MLRHKMSCLGECITPLQGVARLRGPQSNTLHESFKWVEQFANQRVPKWDRPALEPPRLLRRDLTINFANIDMFARPSHDNYISYTATCKKVQQEGEPNILALCSQLFCKLVFVILTSQRTFQYSRRYSQCPFQASICELVADAQQHVSREFNLSHGML